jgi:para-nitrobenzyl esterase
VHTTHSRTAPLSGVRRYAALAGLAIAATGGFMADAAAAHGGASGTSPRVTIDGGAVRGAAVPGGYAFRGLPYAAPPTGNLRWRAPRQPADWHGVRDATEFGPSCPQVASPFAPPGAMAEDCLYLNVSTPTLRHRARRPVLVWIHGGGLTQDAGRNYDGSKLAAEGTVVVTINYRLGLLGFLAHPALARWSGGPSGNYGLMDQQAALRWVRRNIARFGGDPHNVTIAGESAGGLSVLAHMVSRRSRGLFQRAIVQSGAFALKQQSLADAEAAGVAFAGDATRCPDQTATCLRSLSVDQLEIPGALIPGVVDGKVLEESIGTALAAGRFARVPLMNGVNHDENRLFVMLGAPVIGGRNILVSTPTTAAEYEPRIATAFAASPERAAAIAAEYPIADYADPATAFSTLVSDAGFVCPALQVDRWTSTRVQTFAYQLDDDAAPHRFTPPGFVPAVATHADELQYLFDLPSAPVPRPLSADQENLAAKMRAAWARFAATGHPGSSAGVRWPAIGAFDEPVLSLLAPQPRVDTAFALTHHCAFWAAG